MKMRNVFIMMFCLYIMVITVCYCEENENASNGLSHLILPVFLYSTDTGFGAGFTGMTGYNPSRIRISTIRVIGLYTLKKQVNTSLKWDHYCSGNRDRIGIECKYRKFPTYFYGIGNNTQDTDLEKYTPETFYAQFFYERNLKEHFKINAQFHVRNQSLVESEPDGLVRSKHVPWNTGRFEAGPGFAILWDSRDNIIATQNGSLAKLECNGAMFQDEGGAFNSWSLDMRKFINPLSGVVLASMAWVQDFRGDVPFYMLSKLGGDDRLRGYRFERFRDRSLFLIQQDIRCRLWGPIGGALFAATGRVADEITGLFSGVYHTGYGAGLRYYFDEELNLMVRFDAAWGSDTNCYYINFGEAF